jgi:hypothetical protein
MNTVLLFFCDELSLHFDQFFDHCLSVAHCLTS